jgi:nitroreductase
MHFYDIIRKRDSIKNFTDRPIDNSKVQRIINSFLNSPSWKNNKSPKIILVNNIQQKHYLASCVVNDVNSAANSLNQAPLVAIVVADPVESGIIDDKEFYLVDSAIAMEHLVLAATNEGYGTCWIASIDENKIKQILDIPHNYRVVAMTPIGEVGSYPIHKNSEPQNQNHVFWNSWNNSIK